MAITRESIPLLLTRAAEQHQGGRCGEAAELYQQVLAADPHQPDALHLLGVVWFQQGKLREACQQIRRAIQQRPVTSGYHVNLARVHRALGEWAEARDVLNTAMELCPPAAELHLELAVCCEHLCLFDAAEQAYRAALELQPDAETCGRLAQCCEVSNRWYEAREVAQQGLVLDGCNLTCRLVLARCHRREGQPAVGLAQLEQLASRPEAQSNSAIQFERGRLLDALDRTAEAWEAFARGRALAAARQPPTAQPKRLDREVAALTQFFQPERTQAWSPLAGASENETPVFVTGFPRSGTTLLRELLAGHPQLNTLHEHPAAANLRSALARLDAGYPGSLASLTDQQARDLRRLYWQSLPADVQRAERRLIDVSPLHLFYAGILARIFRGARFIVILRHPCDVCLSCVMQEFGSNDLTAHFHDLATTVQLYDAAMRLWTSVARALGLRYHVLHYESLVTDSRGTLEPLLAELELPWKEDLLEFYKRAGRGERIKTASYHQVAERLHDRAINRWQRYAAEMHPHHERLLPWIEYWNRESASRTVARS